MVRWILIANASHARLVRQDGDRALEPVWEFDPPSSRHARRPRDRVGRRTNPAHAGAAPMAAPREARQRERERFASELASALESGARERRFDSVAVLAGPSLLVDLRPRLGPLTRAKLEAECVVDLGHVGWSDLGPRIDSELRHTGWPATGPQVPGAQGSAIS